MKTLRDYQEEIVNKVVNSDKDQIICLPTGAGKTVIASAIMERLPQKVVFVVPRLELIKQARDEFGDVDIIWSDKTEITGKKVVVASKDSLRTQHELVSQNVVLIFDEVHVSLEATYKLVQLIKPVRVLGLTATPERMDGQALLKGTDSIHKFGCFDELIQQETVPSLIEKGYLTKLRYYTRPIEGITEIKPTSAGEELSDEQMTEIFDKNAVWGDLVTSYEQYGKGRPALGFTNTIAMGEKVVAIFKEAGYDFRIIHGGMSMHERESLIEQLRTHKVDGLVNAALLTYGFDCPPVSYAFSCRHIKSRPLWFQIVGRILRLSPGKEDTIFVDHGDSISEFAEPTCSLPILDPFIQWRVNGEDKEQKKARKIELKRVQETMALLQELDPLPVNMVEVTPDNTWDRLIKLLQKFQKENGQLAKLVQNLNAANQKLSHEKEDMQERLKAAKTEKFIDSQATFDWCRKNYPYLRGMVHDEMKMSKGYWQMAPEVRVETEHAKTVELMKEKTDKLKFLIDEHTFLNSTKWWKEHWQPRNDGPAPAFAPVKTGSEETKSSIRELFARAAPTVNKILEDNRQGSLPF